MSHRSQGVDVEGGRILTVQGANFRDIVIAETALKLGAVLVSDDAKLRQVIAEFGGTAVPSAGLA